MSRRGEKRPTDATTGLRPRKLVPLLSVLARLRAVNRSFAEAEMGLDEWLRKRAEVLDEL